MITKIQFIPNLFIFGMKKKILFVKNSTIIFFMPIQHFYKFMNNFILNINNNKNKIKKIYKNKMLDKFTQT